MFPIGVTVVPPWVMQTFFTSFSPCSFPIWTHTISTWIILNVCFWVWSKTNTEISHLEELQNLQKNCNGTLKFTVVLQYVTTSSLTQRREDYVYFQASVCSVFSCPKLLFSLAVRSFSLTRSGDVVLPQVSSQVSHHFQSGPTAAAEINTPHVVRCDCLSHSLSSPFLHSCS